MNEDQHGFVEYEEPGSSPGIYTREFIENKEPGQAPFLKKGRELENLTKPETMRLLIGLPVVYSALLLYMTIAAFTLLGWTSTDVAKDVLAIIAVLGTLAGTVIGFFFGEKKAGQ